MLNPSLGTMFSVYLLRSRRDAGFYIGLTEDLLRRLEEHNQGRVPSTKDRRPLALIYYESYVVEADARKREEQLKRHAGAFTSLKRRLTKTLSE